MMCSSDYISELVDIVIFGTIDTLFKDLNNER